MKKPLSASCIHRLVTALALATPQLLTAQTQPISVDESEFFADIPIVTSATRLPQPIDESPVAITYIDREMIAASGATEVSQILKLVPGFMSYSALGNQFGVTNRGVSYSFPGDLEITIDGRSVYLPLLSLVDWTSLGITPEDIEYMEVVRGTNAAAYGSNAFLGAIHIVTNRPARAQGLSLNLLAGSRETRNGQLDYSGNAGIVDYSMGLVYRHNEGFPRLGNMPPEDRMIDGNEALSFRFEALATPSVTDTIRFHTGAGNSRIEIPADGLAGGEKGFNVREVESSYQLLRWQHTLPDSNEFQLQFHHNRTEVTELVDLGLLSDALGVPPEFIPVIFDGQEDESIVAGLDDALSERYDLEYSQTFNAGQSSRGVFGGGVRYDRVRSEYLLNRADTVDRWSYRLFADFEHAFSKNLLGNVGLMAEDSNIVGTVWSPRAALNYSLNKRHSIRISASRGNRIPSLLEAFQDQALRFSDGTVIEGDVIFDPDIDKSTVDEFDIGFISNHLNGRLSTDLRILRTEARDIIDDTQTGPNGFAVLRSNFIDWSTNGFDAQIKYLFAEHSQVSFQYAYTDFEGDHSGRSRVKGRPSNHSASLLLSTRWRGLDLSATVYHQSYIQYQDGDAIDSTTRTDLRIAKEFFTPGGRFAIEFIGQSLFDSYSEYIHEQRFEPRYFLKLSYKPG